MLGMLEEMRGAHHVVCNLLIEATMDSLGQCWCAVFDGLEGELLDSVGSWCGAGWSNMQCALEARMWVVVCAMPYS
jgi:hypothetical protein